MNAQSRLFTSFMVLCLFSQASWIQGQTFQKVRFLQVVGDKTKEVKADLIVAEDSIQVRDSESGRTLKKLPYSEIKSATYSFSEHRRWRAGAVAVVAVNVFAAPLFFMKGKKHWLTFETEEGHPGLRLDKSNFEEILSAVDRRLKDATTFDGYREGTIRMDSPSLENKDAQGNEQSPGIEEALSEGLYWDPGSLEPATRVGGCANGSSPTWRICRTSSATTRSTATNGESSPNGY